MSLMVCALLGLAFAVLYDVACAPRPAATTGRVETPVVIVGLERLRRVGGRRRSEPEVELPDVNGEVELETQNHGGELAFLPSIIVED